MLRALLDLARGAQTAPVPTCSCAKGLAVGVECLQAALRGKGFAFTAPAGGAAQAAAAHSRGGQRLGAWPQRVEGRGAGGGGSGVAAATGGSPGDADTAGVASTEQLAAAFHSVDPLHCDLPAHDAHALRNIMLRSP